MDSKRLDEIRERQARRVAATDPAPGVIAARDDIDYLLSALDGRRHLPHWSEPPHEAGAFNKLLDHLGEAMASISNDGQVCTAVTEEMWRELVESLSVAPVESAVCTWSYDDIDDAWRTGCGDQFCLSDPPDPAKHGMLYCYHCGNAIRCTPVESEEAK